MTAIMDDDFDFTTEGLKRPKSRNIAQAWVRRIDEKHGNAIIAADDFSNQSIKARLAAMDAAGNVVEFLGGDKLGIVYGPVDLQIAFCITYSVVRFVRWFV